MSIADKLDSEDFEALLAICKGASEGLPLTSDRVRDPAAALAAVTLRQLHSVQHVNALIANERLTFDKVGITVIYGDNGSGKSGYARVLKKICRACTAGKETIHRNIYDSNPGVPTASIDFAINARVCRRRYETGSSATRWARGGLLVSKAFQPGAPHFIPFGAAGPERPRFPWHIR
jgi:hypothetical protein